MMLAMTESESVNWDPDKPRSLTNHPSARIDDPDPETGASGRESSAGRTSFRIAKRIMNARAGDELIFRGGTDGVVYVPQMCPSMRQRTWGEVFDVLCEAGVVEKKEDFVYEKRVDDFGIELRQLAPDVQPVCVRCLCLNDLIRQVLWERGSRFDVFTMEGLRGFMKIFVWEEGYEFFTEKEIPDIVFDDVCEVFTEELFVYLPEKQRDEAGTGDMHDEVFERCMARIQGILDPYEVEFDDIGRLVCEVFVHMWGHVCFKTGGVVSEELS